MKKIILSDNGKLIESKLHMNGPLKSWFFLCPRDEESVGHIYLPLSVRSFVHPDIDTWFVRLSPPTVLELQL